MRCLFLLQMEVRCSIIGLHLTSGHQASRAKQEHREVTSVHVNQHRTGRQEGSPFSYEKENTDSLRKAFFHAVSKTLLVTNQIIFPCLFFKGKKYWIKIHI